MKNCWISAHHGCCGTKRFGNLFSIFRSKRRKAKMKSQSAVFMGSDRDSSLGSSLATSLAGSNSLTGSSNKFIDAFRFICFQGMRRSLPVIEPILPQILLVIDVLIFTSFAFDPSLFLSGDADRATPFSEMPWFAQILYVLRYVRSLRAFVPTVAYIFVAITGGCFSIIGLQMLVVIRSSIGFRFGYYVLKFVIVVGSTMGTVSASSLLLEAREPLPIHVVLGVAFAAFTILGQELIAAFAFDFRPSLSKVSVAHPRFRHFWYNARVLLVILDTFVNNSSMAGASRSGVVGYASAVVVVFLILTALHVFIQPHFSATVNRVLGGALSAFFIVSVFGLAAILSPASTGSWLLLAAVFAGAAAFVGGFFLVILRERLLARKVRSFAAGNGELGVRFPFEVELAARFVYNLKEAPTKTETDLADGIFRHGAEAFPGSAFIRIARATFFVEIAKDLARMKKAMLAAKSLKPAFDLDYQLYCLSTNSGKDVKADDAEIDLLIARLHHSAAKKAMLEFWTKVSHAKRGIDQELLLSIAGKLDHHESAAQSIFTKLLSANPNNVTVLRAFAFFIQDILDEPEQAEALFQNADELEEAQSRAKRRKEQAMKKTRTRIGESSVRIVEVSPEQAVLPGAIDLDEATAGPAAAAKHEDDEEEESEAAPALPRMSSKMSVSSAGSELSDARTKIIQYRAKIASQRNDLARGFQFAMAGSYSVLFLVVMVIVVAEVFVNRQLHTTDSFKDGTAAITVNLQKAVTHVRLLSQGVVPLGSSLNASLGALDSSWEAMTSTIDTTMLRTLKEIVPITRYFPDTPLNETTERPTENMTLWSAIQASIGAVHAVSTKLDSGASVEDLSLDVDYRFLLDNFQSTIVSKMKDLQAEVGSLLSTAVAKVDLSIEIAVPLCIAACIIASYAIFVPSRRSIIKERRNAIGLFYEVPKSSSLSMAAALSAESEKMEQRYHAGRVSLGTRKTSIVKQMTLSFTTITTCLALLGIASMLSILLIGREAGGICAFNSSNLRIALTGQTTAAVKGVGAIRQQSLEDLNVLQNEYAIHDRITWNPAALAGAFNGAMASYRGTTDMLQLVFYETGLSPEIRAFLTTKPCPPEFKCSGLLQFNEVFVTACKSFANTPTEMQSFNSTYSLRARDIHANLTVWLAEYQGIVAALSGKTSTSIINTIASLLAVAFVLMVLGLFLTSPMIHSMKDETTKAHMLLLRLPLNVLTNVDAIREFLEHGFTEYQASAKDMAEEQDRRTKVILDASKDAVVIMTERLDVSFLNPAAEELLGRKVDDVLGKSFLPLLGVETATLFRQAVEKHLAKMSEKEAGADETIMDRLRRRKKKKKSRVDDVEMAQRRLRRKKKVFSFGEGLTDLSVVLENGETVPVLMSAVMTAAATSDSQQGAATKSIVCFLKDISVIKENEAELEKERRRADMLLQNILPPAIIDMLKASPGQTVARKYESVTVLFADIVEFTPKASGLPPEELVKMLNGVFSGWDRLATEFGVEKVKTIGDAFMAACGVPQPCKDHAARMVRFAVAMLEYLDRFNAKNAAEHTQIPQLAVRIGINTGPVVAGVIGITKLQYDLWGDAVNIAARLESTGLPNRIQLTKSTVDMLSSREFHVESRGMVKLKGKGDMECFLLAQSAGHQQEQEDRPISAKALADARTTPAEGSLRDLLGGFVGEDRPASSAAAARRRQATSSRGGVAPSSSPLGSS